MQGHRTPGRTSGTIGQRAPGAVGAEWEDAALAYLQQQGLRLLERNYRCKVGEIDLIMQDGDGQLIFVEVRARTSTAFGGAAASIGHAKQRRLLRAMQWYLMRHAEAPPCRIDVVAFDAGRLQWLRNAFEL